MLFAEPRPSDGNVLFGDGDRIREFAGLIEFDATLVDRLQFRWLLLRPARYER